MANFLAMSIWMKVALICLLIGTILYLIGFSTVSWMTSSNYQGAWDALGLWRRMQCRQYCVTQPYYYGSVGLFRARYNWDFIRATQALECIGLICDFVALLVLLLYLCVDSCRRRNALIAVIVLIFAAVFFIVVGIAVFGIKLDSQGFSVGWSMGFAIVGAIFMFISGVMCILQTIGR